MVKSLKKVDVVVVGSGAAGSVYAALLAEAGKRVLILERGRARAPEDLYSSQIWARRLKWGAPHVQDAGADSVWFNFNAGHGVGGSAIHHYGVWPRFHPEDFTLQTRYGWGLDWPFGYDELRPFYDQVQEDVGISGDARLEIWRPPGADYPLPPVAVTNHGRVLAKGFEKLGMHTAPSPMAILSTPYKGRPGCLWDGWCDAGCPIGALANPLAVYLPRAARAGARLQTNAHVTRVLTDAQGRRATGVEYVDATTGERLVQPADAVVLCAFIAENPRILLNSANGGLANRSGALGRYLMSHLSVSIYGLFDEDMQNASGATGGQLICHDRFGKRSDPGGAFGSRQWAIGIMLKPNDLLGIAMSRPDIYGQALHDFMLDGARHMGSMVSICEDEPRHENRIELAGGKDQYGMPLARAHYRASDNGRTLWDSAAKEGVDIFKAAGAREAWHGPRGAQHLMGGTIMGKDPAASVTNGVAQTHDIANLFIGGPGLFPTTSAVNPTFTVHAIAMKSARFMIENWASLHA